MKNNKNLKNLETLFVKNSDDWVKSLRLNLFTLLDQPGVTLRSLSEIAGVNYDTFKSFLYGDSKNCKVGALINVSRAFGFSLDALIGAGTVDLEEQEILKNYRALPPAVAYYYKWSLDYFISSNGSACVEQSVPLLRPLIWSDGSLHISPEVGVYNVTSLAASLAAKIKAAIVLPCDYYMPHYSPFHVLFLANDREQLRGEHSVVLLGQEMIITEIKDGGCYSIRDGGFRCPLSAIDTVLGYVAGSCLLDEPVV